MGPQTPDTGLKVQENVLIRQLLTVWKSANRLDQLEIALQKRFEVKNPFSELKRSNWNVWVNKISV